MPRLARLLAAALVTALALVSADCTLDPYCEQGEPGCSADPCHDLLRDGDEADVDCGGSCAPCGAGASCAAAADCASARCLSQQCCDPPCVIWSRHHGGPAFEQATSAVFLPDGTLVLAGDMRGTLDLGGDPLITAGGWDIFVAAFAPGGALRWQRRFGGPATEFSPRLTVSPDGQLWLAGVFGSPTLDTGAGKLHGSGGFLDLFVVALDGEGNTLKARAFGSQGTSVVVGDLAATEDGGLLLTGTFVRLDLGDGTVLVSTNGPVTGGPVDVYLLKLGADLKPAWHRQLGDEHNDFTFGIDLDAAGDVVIGLLSDTTASFGGPVLPDPGMAIVAYGGADGAYRWGRSYGRGVNPSDLAVDPDGGFHLAGNLVGEADLGTGKLLPKGTSEAFVARLDPLGVTRWVTPLTGAVETYAGPVLRDPSGGAILGLRLTGALDLGGGVTTATGVDSLAFVGLDGDGHPRWARSEGGIVLGTTVGLALAPDARFLAFGGHAGTLELGAPAKAAGNGDVFVAELLP